MPLAFFSREKCFEYFFLLKYYHLSIQIYCSFFLHSISFELSSQHLCFGCVCVSIECVCLSVQSVFFCGTFAIQITHNHHENDVCFMSI